MTAGMKADRAKFFCRIFSRDFYGVSLLSHPVSEELIANSCNVSMTAGSEPFCVCAGAAPTRPDLPLLPKCHR
jgi:hypothetical protein